MLELRIFNPQEDFTIKPIKWNYEELKNAIADKVQDYANLEYNDSQVAEAKKDRSTLNNLSKALKAKKKEVKDLYLSQFEPFAQQIDECIALVDNAATNIKEQCDAFEDRRKDEKMKEIMNLFPTIGFPSFVYIEQIIDMRWLNKTFSMKDVEKAMKDRMYQIGDDVKAIHESECTFEALEVYKRTLDLSKALAEGMRIKQIADNKRAEEETRRQAEAEAMAKANDGFREEPKAEPEKLEYEKPESIPYFAGFDEVWKSVTIKFVYKEEDADKLNSIIGQLSEYARMEVIR